MMKPNYYSTLICSFFMMLLLYSAPTVAQQDTQYTQYMFNGLVLNPAYAGTSNAISMVSIYRHQWANIEGAPRTLSLSIHSPVKRKVGLGLMLEYDAIGVHDKITLNGSYAYRFQVGYGTFLSAGLQGGFQYYRSNWTQALTEYNTNDPLYQDDLSSFLPNFGAGLYLYSKNYYLGFSVPHLVEQKIYKETDGGVSRLSKQYRHYLLTGGIMLPVGANFQLKPSFLMKSVPAISPLQVDVNLSLLIKETLWVGASYRVMDSFDFIMEVQFPNFLRIGYSYDFTTTEISSHTTGTHEIMIGYDFGMSKERVVTPRYF